MHSNPLTPYSPCQTTSRYTVLLIAQPLVLGQYCHSIGGLYSRSVSFTIFNNLAITSLLITLNTPPHHPSYSSLLAQQAQREWSTLQ